MNTLLCFAQTQSQCVFNLAVKEYVHSHKARPNPSCQTLGIMLTARTIMLVTAEFSFTVVHRIVLGTAALPAIVGIIAGQLVRTSLPNNDF